MIRFFFSLFFAIIIINCSLAQTTNGKLNLLNPIAFGYKTDVLQKIAGKASDSIPSLGSILVWRKNGLILENYYNSANDTTAFDVKSVTKSVTSALTGIVSDQHLLPDLNTPVLTILPEYLTTFSQNKNIWYANFLETNDSLKRLLRLRDLLTMQTGFLWDDNNPLIHRAFQASSDPVRFMLELTYENKPGTKFKYCTGACQIVSAILSKYTKNNLRAFADSMLFKPAGISISSWPVDALGRLSGGSALMMTPQNMLKFGLIFLHDGKVNGKQILSKSWIKESTSMQVQLNEWDVIPQVNGYGYYWWRRITNGHQAIVASGYGGQLICIIPDLDMIIVTTCFINETNRGRSEIKRLHGFIDEIIKASE